MRVARVAVSSAGRDDARPTMSARTSTILFLLGLAALAAVLWKLRSGDEGGGAPRGRPPFVLPVTLAEVRAGELRPAVELTGSVVSGSRSRIGFERAGRVTAIAALEGAAVEAGDLLATLDARDAQAELARATAAQALAERELERVLSGERDEVKRRLAAELAVREAEADLARRELERGEELVRTQVISESALDALRAERTTADSRVQASREALGQAQAGSRAEDIAVQRAQLELRRADVALAQRELDKCELRAPFPAAVVRRLASVGDSLAPGVPVLELVDRSRREVELEIPASAAARLGGAPRVRLALDEVREFQLETALDAFVPVADEQSRVFRGVVRLEAGEDVAGVLKPGMFVRARLELAPLPGVLLVPSDAVRVMGQGTVLVRAKSVPGEGGAPSLSAEFVPVRVLGAMGGESAVEALEGGLAAGERVVASGAGMAFPGAPLLPRADKAGATQP